MINHEMGGQGGPPKPHEQTRKDDFNAKINEIGQVLLEYQSWFDRGPDMVNDDIFGSALRKMPCNTGENQKEAYMHIIKLARMLSHLS